MPKLTADKLEDIAHQYWVSFLDLEKKAWFPVSNFEKHKAVKKLLAEEPVVQIAYVHYMADHMRGMRLIDALTVKPIRVLTAADRANPRKVKIFNHFAHMWDVPKYSVPAALALEILLRRDLPLTHDDLVSVANQIADMKMIVLSCQTYMPGLARHLQTYVDKHGATLELSKAIGRLASAMKLPDPPADHQAVYRQLKKLATVKPAKSKKPSVSEEASPEVEAAEHFAKMLKIRGLDRAELLRHKDVLAAMQAEPAVQVAIARMTMERIGDVRKEFEPFIPELEWDDPDYKHKYKAHYKCLTLEETKTFPSGSAHFMEKMFGTKLPFTAKDLTVMVKRLADLDIVWVAVHKYVKGLLNQIQRHVDECGVTPELAQQMERLAKAMDWPGITRTGTTGAAEQRRSIDTLRQWAAQAVAGGAR
jgi:hypothetical protein